MRRDVMDFDINDLDRIVEYNRNKGFTHVYVQEETGALVGCRENPPEYAKPIEEFFADIRTRMLQRGSVRA